MAWQTPHNPSELAVSRPAITPGDRELLAALDHYDACRQLRADALRVAGPDSGEYMRADAARRIALVLLDAALQRRRAAALGGGGE